VDTNEQHLNHDTNPTLLIYRGTYIKNTVCRSKYFFTYIYWF